MTKIRQDIVDAISDELSKAIAEEIDAEILESIRVAGLTQEEREAEEIIRRLKAPPKKRMWDIDEIMRVQPMTKPTGQIFTMRVKWGIDKTDLDN